MNILQICAVGFTYDKFLSPLANALKNRGHNVSLSFNPSYSTPDSISRLPFQLHTIPVKRRISPFNLLLTSFAIYRILRSNRFDVVHIHTPLVSIPARIACFLSGSPLVIYTAHGFYFHENMSPVLRLAHVALEYFLSKITHILFTQSQEDADYAISRRFLPPSRIICIGNGVSSARFYPVGKQLSSNYRQSLSLPLDKLIIGIVARKVVEKGYLELLDASLQLISSGYDFCLAMCGSALASDHSRSVQPRVDQLLHQYPDHFVDLGERADVEHFYKAIDIFCLPSWREGMPRTIIEAMMTSLPVVASNIRGSREEVVHGSTGLLFDVRDAGSLASSLALLLESKDIRQSMGAEARARSLSLYDEEKILNHQISVIESFCNPSP